MPRKNADGRFILSAGEIAEYSVCPEAWRLRVVERERDRVRGDATGKRLHKEWASEVDLSAHLFTGLKVVIALVVAMIAVVLIVRS